MQRYIVHVSDPDALEQLASELEGVVKVLRRVHMIVLDTDEATAEGLRSDPRVDFVEADQAGEPAAEHTDTQAIVNEWQLDRIDQRELPLNDEYTWSLDGSGVHVYVIDSGIRDTHEQFTGRMGTGYSAVGGSPHTDNEGHGTSVAGALAGSTTGPARGATIHSIRVWDTGSIFTADFSDGVDWILNNHDFNDPAIVNISLGWSGGNSTVDNAVNDLINAGIQVIAAAMNNDTLASSSSPGRVANVLTVSSTEIDDSFRSGHNHGSAVNLLAPGRDIWVPRATGDTDYDARGGTSYAAPFVAGVLAMALEHDDLLTPSQLRHLVTTQATPGVITGLPANTTNRLLYAHIVDEHEPEDYTIDAITESGTWDWEAAGSPETVEVLIVAGGGGGGGHLNNDGTGGGGGGGVVYHPEFPVSGDVSAVIGSGGSGSTGGGEASAGSDGGNSEFGTLTAIGGGGGGASNSAGVINGRPGGSGGGGGGSTFGNAGSGGAGTVDQGRAGGAGEDTSSADARAGGGGGGAGSAGGNASTFQGGNGGAGIEFPRFSDYGVSGWFAGGGGGTSQTGGSGGQGGGGDGANATGNNPGTPGAGVDGTGGGGGANSGGGAGADGGDGIILIRYVVPTPQSELAGASIGVGDTSGDLQFTRNLTGLSAGIGASTGLLSVDTGLNLLVGASIGTGYSEGALHIARNLAGVSVGIGESAGILSVIDSNIILLSGASVGVGVSSAAVQMDIHLRGASIGEGSSIHRYLGPGYGIVDSPPPTVIDRAQPGDSFPVHLPWAGLYGMSGLARVLSVQIREGKRTINAQFIPMPDEALIPGLAKGEPIRYTPRIQNDPFKLNRENQRGIRRIDRSQRR